MNWFIYLCFLALVLISNVADTMNIRMRFHSPLSVRSSNRRILKEAFNDFNENEIQRIGRKQYVPYNR